MVKEVIKKTVGKKFTELTPEQRKKIVNQVRKIPEFAKKTKGEIRKILNKVFTKIPTRRYKKKEKKPLFDPSDRILAKDGDVTMVNRPSKLKPDLEAMKGTGSGQKIIRPQDIKESTKTGKLVEKLETGSIEKPIRGDTPIMDMGRSLPGGVSFNKGGRVRSYRGYGKARKG